MKRYIIYMAVLLVVITMTWAIAAEPVVEVKSVLAGTVSDEQLVVAGQLVKEGDTLICVNTLTGSSVAARATVDGTVKRVLVTPGVKVKSGDVVVELEAAR